LRWDDVDDLKRRRGEKEDVLAMRRAWVDQGTSRPHRLLEASEHAGKIRPVP
jgi:hypothetical protein